MTDRDAITLLIAEVLDGTELKLKIDTYELKENLETREVQVRCELHHQKTGERHTIEGNGVGIIDAAFSGLRTMYAEEYPSLASIRLADFRIKVDRDTGHGSGSDMIAAVTLTVENSEGRLFYFTDTSRSLTLSALAVVLDATEFFVNSERAFIQVYKALDHARQENRSDSVQRYTRQLSTLVECTSYSEVMAQIRQKEFS